MYPDKTLPKIKLNLLLDLEALEAMVKEAREKGRAQLNCLVIRPQIEIQLETINREDVAVLDTDYGKAVVDEKRRTMHVTTW